MNKCITIIFIIVLIVIANTKKIKDDKDTYECHNSCLNGVCYKGECWCYHNYYGISCDQLYHDGLKVNLLVLIFIFVGGGLVSSCITILIFFIFKKCCAHQKYIYKEENFNLWEQWEVGKQNS